MWQRIVADLRRRPLLYKSIQHLVHTAIFNARCELAVGKSPCPALSKADVAIWVQLAPFAQSPNILFPLFHPRSPLQNQGAIAMLGKQPRGEQAGRAGSCHHDASPQCLFSCAKRRKFLMQIGLPALCKQPRAAFFRNADENAVFKAQISPTASVYGFAHNLHLLDFLGRYTQPFRCKQRERLFRLLNRPGNFV